MKTFYVTARAKGNDFDEYLTKVKAKSEQEAIKKAKKEEFDNYRHYKAIGIMPNVNPAEMVQGLEFRIFS